MKKQYISPQAEVYHVDMTCSICQTSQYGSVGTSGSLPSNYEGVGGGGGKGGGWKDYEGTDTD